MTWLGEENAARARATSGGVIYACWHSRMAAPLYVYRGRDLQVLVTHQRHGQYLAETLPRMGFGAVRGKSATEAVRQMLEKARAGQDLAVTPDGPHGPPEVVQPGIIYLAQKTRAAIVPMGVSYSHAVRLPTWDGYRVPLPFTRVLLRIGEPLRVPQDCDSSRRESLRQELQRKMDALHAAIDEAVRQPWSSMRSATSSQSGKNGQRTHSAQIL